MVITSLYGIFLLVCLQSMSSTEQDDTTTHHRVRGPQGERSGWGGERRDVWDASGS